MKNEGSDAYADFVFGRGHVGCVLQRGFDLVFSGRSNLGVPDDDLRLYR